MPASLLLELDNFYASNQQDVVSIVRKSPCIFLQLIHAY